MTAENPAGQGAGKSSDGQDTMLDELLARYVGRLNRGEMLDRDEILREHPEHAAALVEHLSVFKTLASGQDSEPATLGGYKLLREIGSGGMGVVYEAWQSSLNRRVALKVLPGGVAAHSKAVARFVREAQVAGKLNHPNVVRVYGMGLAEQTPYYAMEFVEGQTLAEVLALSTASAGRLGEAERNKQLTTVSGLLKSEQGSREEEPGEAAGSAAAAVSGSNADGQTAEYFTRVAERFAAVADGLEHAHRNGIIHRDIKPSNLIVDKAGQLRILDFGLARIEGEQTLTLTGDFLGTVLYVSPEQAMARRIPVDHRTDIYSLGATLYEMLTWQPPFKGKTHRDTLSQIIFRDPPAPRRAFPRVPRDLETIAMKCLRKNPQDRYATAEALARDLRRFAGGHPIEARPQPRWQKAARLVWRQRLQLSAAVLLLALAGLVAHLALRPTEMSDRVVWQASLPLRANAVSPDGRYLSYDRYDELWIRTLDTGESRCLKTQGARPDGSVFSPDGTRIVCAWLTGGEASELHIASVEGDERRVLCRRPGVCQPCSWSGDGKEILVLLGGDGESSQLALVSAVEGTVQIIRSVPSSLASRAWGERWRPPSVFLSPDGGAIVFQTGGEIVLTTRETSWNDKVSLVARAEDWLSRFGQSKRLVGWTSDGRSVLFCRRQGQGGWDLWSVRVADRALQRQVRALGPIEPLGCTRDGHLCYGLQGVEPRLAVYCATLDLKNAAVVVPPKAVTPSATEAIGCPRWTPDGRCLGYVSRDTQRSFSLYELSTGQVRVVEPGLDYFDWPCFSPDGQRLAVWGWQRTNTGRRQRGICLVDTNSGAFTRIPDSAGAHQPQWLPDGASIVYLTFDREERVNRIMQRELASGNEKELVRAPVPGGMPSSYATSVRFALSPSGNRLLFWSYEEQAWVLKVLALQSGETKKLYRVPKPRFLGCLAWSPDSSYVLVAASGHFPHLRVIPAQGGEVRTIDLGPGRFWNIHLHPDGRRLAFDRHREPLTYEIHLLENFLRPPEGKEPASAP